MAKSASDYEKDYTDPELRERLKEEIKDSDRGGRAGQWSARKSQLLTQEYEKRGGGYRHPGERTSSQKSLQEWTEQGWQTEGGSANARHDGETERYLPRTAWEEMTPKQKRDSQDAKRKASAQGRQHADNPKAARSARADAELDSMNADEAVKRAGSMDADEAAAALAHERDNKGRKTVLRRLEKIAGRGGKA